MPEVTQQLNRIEGMLHALSAKVDQLLQALADEGEDGPELTLDGVQMGGAREQGQSLG
jgi:hypothetical protein